MNTDTAAARDNDLASLTRAIAISPSSPQVRWNLALTQLQLGDFKDGWSNFESRWAGCENLRGGYQMPVDRAWERWLLNRSDSPWYAALRQFRQPRPGDWETPIAAVAVALADVSGRE
jgi:hypothetical protein